MSRDEKSISSVMAVIIENGDLIGTENGCFITSDDVKNDTTMKTTEQEPIKNTKRQIQFRPKVVAKRAFPPPLTTLVTRRRPPTVPKRFHFVRSCSDDGQRVVVRAHETNYDNQFYLKVTRNDDRLTMNLIPITDADVDDDDSEADDDHDDGKREQFKVVNAAVADHCDSSRSKLAFSVL